MITAIPAFAQSGRGVRSGPGTGDPYEHLVPWRFLTKGGPLLHEPLVLYWLPASAQEAEQSPLLSSRELLQAADLCIGFEIVVPDDAAMIAKLGHTGTLPAAVLVNDQGNVIRRVEGTRGRLTAPPVEKMVRDELSARGEIMYARMTEAKKRAAAGDKEGAIDLYKKLWDDRCLFPLAGTEAQHALKTLGVTVVEPPPVKMVDPNLAPPATTTAKPKTKPPGEH
jgi:hypothetical protein